MKLNRLHSITLTSLLALLLFTGCQDETDALPSEGRRTITLDLGIAMTRATEDDQVVRGEANDLKIWLFDQDGRFLQYIEENNPKFTGRDLQGNPVESVKKEFDITDVTLLQFRVLLNTDGLTLKDADGNLLADYNPALGRTLFWVWIALIVLGVVFNVAVTSSVVGGIH